MPLQTVDVGGNPLWLPDYYIKKGQPQGIAPTNRKCRGNPLWLPFGGK
jgi:hypothetical protein